VVLFARDLAFLPGEAIDFGQRPPHRPKALPLALRGRERRSEPPRQRVDCLRQTPRILRVRVIERNDLDALGREDLREGVRVGAVALGDADDAPNPQTPRRRVNALDPGARVRRKAVPFRLGHERQRVRRRDEDVVEVQRRRPCRQQHLHGDRGRQPDGVGVDRAHPPLSRYPGAS